MSSLKNIHNLHLNIETFGYSQTLILQRLLTETLLIKHISPFTTKNYKTNIETFIK